MTARAWTFLAFLALAASTGAAGRAVLVVGQGLNEPFGVSFDTGREPLPGEDGRQPRPRPRTGRQAQGARGQGREGGLWHRGSARGLQLNRPHGAAVRPGTSALYVSDTENHRVIRIGRKDWPP